MFLQKPGYTQQIIKDLYTVWVPPVPDHSLIEGWERKRSDQFWRRKDIPKFYQERRDEEAAIQEKERRMVEEGVMKQIRHFDPALERYRRQEWTRRIMGHWFMNNGKPVYITGSHYMYLQWSKFDHAENDSYPIFYENQVPRFYFRQLCWEDPYCLGYIVIGPRGTGKCLGKGTKVMMYEGGFKKVEDVVVGDLLMGNDSTPRKVLKLSSGIDNMFEVVQNKGINYVVNSTHVLSLKRNTGKSFTGSRKRGLGTYKRKYPEYGKICNMKVGEFIGKSQTFKNTFSGYKVGVDYSEKKLPLDPYFLGLWLGDGTSAYTNITSMDLEIVEWLHNYTASIGQKITKQKSKTRGKASSYCISSFGHRSSKNPLLDTMRSMDLINNKHIPNDYLYNSKENRLKLLAGLIDTDGYYGDGGYEIIQVRKELLEQIQILVNSLGFRSRISLKIINGTAYYRMWFSGLEKPPVLLDRKINRGNPNKDMSLTRINEINYLGKGEYFGFEVDGNHLFCLEDGTVTHNSSEEISVICDNMTKPGHNRHAALQSKTADDAQTVLFTEKLVPLFNAYPDFFKPEYNHGSAPETKMIFRRDAKGGQNAKKMKFGPDYELGNTIRFVSAKEKALDGKTLADILNDEVGKTDSKKEANVHTRTQVNVKSVFRNKRKTGLLRETSTVEEMDKGGDQAYEIWKESDPRVRDGNGYTVSKIYKYFISALETQTNYADVFGHIPEKEAYDDVMGERLPIQDDAVQLSAVMRKNPLTEEEAFIKDAAKCIFNVFIITARINELRHMPKLPGRVGKFAWVDKEDGDVDFIDDPLTGKARIWMAPDVAERGDRKIANACQFTYDDKGKKLWLPCNDDIFSSGSDPIKFVKTDDPRASKMAAYGFWNFDHTIDDQHMPVNTWRSHNFMWTYHGRSEDPEDDYEQIIMAMRWYGHSHMPESNIADFNKHLKSRGYNRFRIVRRDFDDSVLTQKKGLAQQESVQSVPEVQNTYIRMLKQLIQRHGMRINDLEFLVQARDFDPNNTTKFDKVVGAGYTLLASEKKVKDVDTIAEREMIRNIFTKFDVSGGRSRAIVNAEEHADTLTINEILGLPSNY